MKKLSQAEFLSKVMGRLKGALDLSKFEYVNNSTKSTAICPRHGEFLIKPNSLMNGVGCKQCSTKIRGEKRRVTYEEFIARAGLKHNSKYIYSPEGYETSTSKIAIVCPEHGKFYQVAHAHMSGNGCPECSKIKIGDSCRLSQDEFMARLKDQNTPYDLSLVAYKSMGDEIVLSCPEHGQFSARAGNILYNKSGCPECGRSRTGVASRRSFESYVEEARQVHGERFEYTGLEYRDAQAYLVILCKEHGQFKQQAYGHLKGIGCEKCSKPMYNLESFIKIASDVHNDLYSYSESTYTAALGKVTIICAKHGRFQQSPSSHINGQGCPACAKVGPSNAQVEILDYVKNYTDAISEYTIPNTRRRLDVFIPQLNLAIEYHGLIWHSSKFQIDPRSDYKKHKLAESHGIRVIHVYEDEWRLNRSVVERVLLSAIGKLPRVYARKTEVALLTTAAADKFYETNHLQGKCLAEVNYGLTYQGELVACMSFGVARSNRTNSDKSVWELERYAATKTVVGGASKLLKAFISSGRASTIVSYSDTRAFTGNMYKELGFDLVSESPPDYKYVNGNYRFGRQHKSRYQRRHLQTLLPSFDPSKSETENCRDHGLYQIFDCGKKKWVLAL